MSGVGKGGKNGRLFKKGQQTFFGKAEVTNVVDLMRARLAETAIDGRPLAESVVEQWLLMIAKGNVMALKELMERLYGKVKDHVRHEGDVTIRVEYADHNAPAPARRTGEDSQ